MEEIVEAIILGIIQGLTEFLPVSSSGHLELAKFFFSENQLPEESLLMTVMVHGATALSTIVIFYKDIWYIIRQLFRFTLNEETLYVLKIILSMVPAAIIGVAFEEELDILFDRQILLVGCMLVITGILLFFADRAQNTDKKVGYGHALVIGIAQAIAILPGISRSGATISTSVLLGIDRDRAARFSFLMVVPLILGKVAKDLLSGEVIQASSGQLIPLLAAFIAAFLTGLLACTWMIQLVKRAKLTYFAIYCFVVAALAIGTYFLL